jgi:hypothetical protein
MFSSLLLSRLNSLCIQDSIYRSQLFLLIFLCQSICSTHERPATHARSGTSQHLFRVDTFARAQLRCSARLFASDILFNIFVFLTMKVKQAKVDKNNKKNHKFCKFQAHSTKGCRLLTPVFCVRHTSSHYVTLRYVFIFYLHLQQFFTPAFNSPNFPCSV